MAKIGSLKLAQRAEQGATMTVRDTLAETDEDGELPPLLAADGTPATLTLLGADSETARRLDYRRQAAAQNRVVTSMFGGKSKRGAVTADDIAEQYDHDLNRLVTLTVGWHGFEDDEGEPLPFSAEAVKELYAQNAFIREQALSFIQDRTRFFAPSSTPSAPSSSTSSASVSATATA
jgi:hypothetical protein